MAGQLPLLGAGAPPIQDYIVLGSLRSPGICVVRNGSSPRKWDERQGYGFSGATTVFMGTGLARPEVDIILWEPEDGLQWALWRIFAELLKKPSPGKPITGLGIQHPQLNAPPLSITDVVVEDVSQWTQDDDGLWTCTIKFIEYRRPLPILKRPEISIPAVAVPAPTVRDAGDAQLQQLIKRLDARVAKG